MGTLKHSRAVASVLTAVTSALLANVAFADEPAPDKSNYTLLNPVPESAMRAFSPDRPAKSTGPFTVDAGHTQLEMDFVNWTTQKVDGVRTTTLFGPTPGIKVGITNWLDLEASFAPYERVEIEDHNAGTSTGISGVSDLFFRAKINLWGNDGGKTAAAIIPYVKVPTAKDGLGNGATEGGVILPLQISLPKDMTLLLNTEVDVLKNNSGSGYHANYVNVAGLSLPVIKDVTFTGEFWSSINDDPSGVVDQYSIDFALAWTVRPNVQIDGGVNIGLNDDTPDLQLYSGVAVRF